MKIKKFLKDLFINGPKKIANNAAETVIDALESSQETITRESEVARRKSVTDMLCDPKLRLTGSQRRQMERQLETTFYTGKPGNHPAGTITRKLLKMPWKSLRKLPRKTDIRLRRAQNEAAKGTARHAALLKPRIEFLTLWKSALLDVIAFRTAPVNPPKSTTAL